MRLKLIFLFLFNLSFLDANILGISQDDIKETYNKYLIYSNFYTTIDSEIRIYLIYDTKRNFPDIPDDVLLIALNEFFKKNIPVFRKPLIERVIEFYKKYYSLEQIRKMIIFYETEAGNSLYKANYISAKNMYSGLFSPEIILDQKTQKILPTTKLKKFFKLSKIIDDVTDSFNNIFEVQKQYFDKIGHKKTNELKEKFFELALNPYTEISPEILEQINEFLETQIGRDMIETENKIAQASNRTNVYDFDAYIEEVLKAFEQKIEKIKY
ncbi:DUF2059 domain-containing protein [Helicobacter sp. 13S00477-4]|uniref:DUF2059 domain-containing protein n=1 Tax=Helicobacter sp. 13S00477-4 TaxID=1905759 RepID=UPI000BA7ADFC|nr:DUF2059 domain-containing protein [Helicobacter sp. 13S00477-4]PAF51619.1 hypothetical protein BKH44_05245 [Helicobacter sp. 13S00477-4]